MGECGGVGLCVKILEHTVIQRTHILLITNCLLVILMDVYVVVRQGVGGRATQEVPHSLPPPRPYLRPTVVRNHEQRPELARQAGRPGDMDQSESWRTKAALILQH